MRIIFIFFLCVSLNAQEIIWTHNSPIIRTFSSPRTTDLNNDGIKDIILGGGVEGFPTPYGVNAIDGYNGETLWTVTIQTKCLQVRNFTTTTMILTYCHYGQMLNLDLSAVTGRYQS